jgi:hypothetical protein
LLAGKFSHQDDDVISAAIHQVAQVGMMYLGAGALLWIAVVVIALLMR